MIPLLVVIALVALIVLGYNNLSTEVLTAFGIGLVVLIGGVAYNLICGAARRRAPGGTRRHVWTYAPITSTPNNPPASSHSHVVAR